MRSPRLPIATYRLQFNRRFGFQHAHRLLPYLEELGISDLYASPLVQARRGSPHGYEVTDPTRLNTELGTPEEFNKLARELRRRGMGLLLDIVPNHMAASSENPWWQDVLEDGRKSIYASYFDVDWNSNLPAREDKVILPVLGEPYHQALAQGRLRLALEGERIVVRYYDSSFPLRLSSYAPILGGALAKLPSHLTETRRISTAVQKWRRECGLLTDSKRETPPALASRHRRKTVLNRNLAMLLYRYRPLRRSLQAVVRDFNGRPGKAGSFDAIDGLLKEQHYRLCYWRTGEAQINYRRFFDVSALVSLRTEDPVVFAARHALHRRLVRRGQVTGVRVDHVDGLADPEGYLDQLHRYLYGRRPRKAPRDFYVVVEKILSGSEALPPEWRTHGTTGYDFLNRLGQCFISPSGSRRLTNLYCELTGVRESFEDIARAKRRFVMETLFAGELRQLLKLLQEVIASGSRSTRFSPADLRAALVEVTACLPVYRTYIRNARPARRDRKVLRHALRKAGKGTRGQVRSAIRRLGNIFLFTKSSGRTAAQRAARRSFMQRWQQFTGPIMAKGVEDTALYTYSRLLALNEVGGEPDSHGLSADQFHSWLLRRARSLPFSLNATTTHDTKRSEDVRARLCSLSELASEWEERVGRWRRWNRPHKLSVAGIRVPDADSELLIYQTLIGIWPASNSQAREIQGRVREYLIKASREAKVYTRWREVNTTYEQALLRFLDAILRPTRDNRFLSDLENFSRVVARHGALNSLAQLLIKLTAPGIPDFYQGSELWDLRLVDPDNRRPVDFAQRQRWLRELKGRERKDRAGLLAELLNDWGDGRIKLYLLWKALCFRRAHAELFLNGDYQPLRAVGTEGKAVFAFARRWGRQWAVVLVPRLAARLRRREEFPLGRTSWGSSRLVLPASSPGAWQNQLTGERLRARRNGNTKTLPIAEILAQFPVALLIPERD